MDAIVMLVDVVHLDSAVDCLHVGSPLWSSEIPSHSLE